MASTPAGSPAPAPTAPRAPRRHALAARVLVVLTAVVMVFALAAGYTRRAVVDSDQFANRATAALRDDSVRTLIAERVTDQVVLRRRADLLAARPLIESALSGIVGGGAFRGLFRTAVRDVHRAVFDRDEDTITLTVADVGTVLSAALEKLQPQVAQQVRAADRIEVVERHGRALGASVADAARAVRVLAIVLPLVCLLLAAGALWTSPDRRRTVAELGVGAAAAGIAVVVLLGVARAIAVREVQGPDARAAAGAIWNAFLGDLRTAGWVLAACGAIVTAAATSVLRPMDLGERLRRLAERVAAEQPTTPRRALRAIALIAAGVVVLVARDAVLSLVVTAAGVLLIYGGVNALLRLIYRPRTAAADAPAPDGARPPGRSRRRILVPVAAGGLVILVVAAFLGTGGATTAAPRTNACDGHPELCDRPLDQVALVATHNAMAVPLPGWFAAEQDRPIAGQLEDGVRGLLIDTHYADRLRNGRLRTYFGSPEDERRQAAQDGIGPDAVDAALRIRERLGFRGEGTRGMYLCHTFCEVGATSLGSVLRDINTFLVTHPDEVMVVINQDYVTPPDFVRAVNDAGLGDLAYRGPTTKGHWPTLRKMIDTNQRIVFLAENRAGGAPWYHPAYKAITEETPYTFGRVSLLNEPAELAASCRPNRGREGAPLFLINHWISTDPLPRPSDAQAVNAYEPLLRRVRRCEQIRDHIANLVAVNFYRRGDAFRVVDTLNGVGAG